MKDEEKDGLTSWAETVEKTMAREKKEFKERLDYWDSKVGRKVRHIHYLLKGKITGTMVVPVSSLPRILVKWDNGAETSEFPINIKLLRRKKK